MTGSPAGASLGIAAAAVAALAFGINTVGAKLSVLAGIPATAIVLYRVLAMLALVAAAVMILRGSIKIARAAWPAMAVLIVTSAGMGLAYLSSVAFIPVTVAAVIFYTYPVLIVLAGPLATGRRLEPRELGIAVLAFAGIVLVVGPSFDSLDWRGLALAFGGGVLTAWQFFAANRVASEPTAAKLFWTQLGVLPIAAAVALMAGDLAGPGALLAAPLAVATTIVCYVIGSAGLIVALSRLRAAIAGLIFCLEPVISAAAAAIALGERLSLVQYAGGALVLAAVVATIVAPASARAPAAATA